MNNRLLYALQRRTRVTLILCQRALVETNNDIDLAEKVIKKYLKSPALMTDSHWS